MPSEHFNANTSHVNGEAWDGNAVNDLEERIDEGLASLESSVVTGDDIAQYIGPYVVPKATGVAATDRANLAAALNSGARRIEVPAGSYKTVAPSLVIKSNTELVLHRNAEIVGTVGDNCPVMVNEALNILVADGEDFDPADRDVNIRIHGGRWERLANGVGAQNNWTQNTVVVCGIDGFSATDMKLKCAGKWALTAFDITNFNIERIRLDDTNSDGVHVVGPASDGVIRDVSGEVGDDCVALICYDWNGYQLTHGDIEDVLVENVRPINGVANGVQLNFGGGHKGRRVTVRTVRGQVGKNGVICQDSPFASYPTTSEIDVDELLIEDVAVDVPANGAQVLLGPKFGGRITTRGIRPQGTGNMAGVLVNNADNTASIEALHVDDLTHSLLGVARMVDINNGNVESLTITAARVALKVDKSNGYLVGVGGNADVGSISLTHVHQRGGYACVIISGASEPLIDFGAGCDIASANMVVRHTGSGDIDVHGGGLTYEDVLAAVYLSSTGGATVRGSGFRSTLTGVNTGVYKAGSQFLRVDTTAIPINADKVSDGEEGDLIHNVNASADVPVGVCVHDGTEFRAVTAGSLADSPGAGAFVTDLGGGEFGWIAPPIEGEPASNFDRSIGQPGVLAPMPIIGVSAGAMTAARLYLARFVPSKDMTITKIAFALVTAGNAADVIDAGLYIPNGANLDLVTNVAGGAGVAGKLGGGNQVVTVDVTSANITAGTAYYAAFLAPATFAGTTPTIVGTGDSGVNWFGSGVPRALGLYKATVAVPLPASITSGLIAYANTAILAVRES